MRCSLPACIEVQINWMRESENKPFVSVACRILDNVPMVIPVRRLDKEEPPFYLQGMHVGAKEWLVGVG